MWLYLPKIKGEVLRKPKERGIWENNPELINQLSKELDIKGEATKEVLTAIPTIWARPLLFAESLINEEHPLHKQTENEWRGLLGIFCFKKIYNFKIEIKIINISERQESRFLRILNALKPDAGWDKVYLIYVENIPIGATSPRSLFFTPPEYFLSSYIPWQKKIKGKSVLIDPVMYFRENKMKEELGILKKWLEKINEELKQYPDYQHLGRRIEKWYEEISSSECIFPEKINFLPVGEIGEEPFSIVFQYADVPLEKKGDFYFYSERSKKDVIILCKEMLQNVENQNKTVYCSLKVNQIREKVCQIYDDKDKLKKYLKELGIEDEIIQPDLDFFTPKVLKISLNKDNILGNLGEYTIPLKKEFLKYFYPKEVPKYFHWEKEKKGLVAILSLPLKDNKLGESLEIKKIYEDDDIIEIEEEPPIIAIWPNFYCEDWYWYYLIIEKKNGIKLKCQPVTEGEIIDCENKEGSINVAWRVWKSTKKIEAVECQYEDNLCGLIIPHLSEVPEPNFRNEWEVAIDFGTSNTFVAYITKEESNPQTFEFNNRTLILTDVGKSIKEDFLIPRFTPLLESKKGSFPSVFRELKSLEDILKSQVILHGILLDLEKHPQWIIPFEILEGIKVNLKWAESDEERLFIIKFLQHIVLLVMAEACNKGIRKINFHSSYPFAFPESWKEDFQNNWDINILQDFRKGNWNIKFEKFLTESEAVCQYFIGKGEMKIGQTIPSCVLDIGGGTTDIGIWLQHEENREKELIAQASVKLAGGILSEVLSVDKNCYDEIFRLSPLLEKLERKYIFEKLWNEKNKISAGINTLLKERGEENILKVIYSRASSSNFKKIRSIIMFSYGAIFYYLGLLLREVRRRSKVMGCNVFLAGNGARLLKWVGQIKKDSALYSALREIIYVSIDSKDPAEKNLINFTFSEEPKEEVAKGILVKTKIKVAEPLKIIGEEGYHIIKEDGKPAHIPMNKDMVKMLRENPLEKIKAPDYFPQLENYISIYNKQAEKLGLEEIENYNRDIIKNAIESRIADIIKGTVIDHELLQPFFIEEVKVIINNFFS